LLLHGGASVGLRIGLVVGHFGSVGGGGEERFIVEGIIMYWSLSMEED